MPICPEGTISYTIRSGDTLFKIAKHYHTTVHAIVSLNPGLNINNLRVGQIICIRPVHKGQHPCSMGISEAEVNLSSHLKTLWEQHIFWTRLVILSIAYDLPDLNLVSNRLLRNPRDFASLLKPVYGDIVANTFSDLLTSHLSIAAELVKAVKDNDISAATDAEKRWYANADEIAKFLASINPYWSEGEWQRLLYDHLAMTKAEAGDILTHNYASSISVLDQIEKEALQMEKVMTRGIVSQFLNDF